MYKVNLFYPIFSCLSRAKAIDKCILPPYFDAPSRRVFYTLILEEVYAHRYS